MDTQRKITILLPEALVTKALAASGEGLTPTIRRGLELVAAARVFARLGQWRGRFKSQLSLKKLREDRT